MHNDILRDDDVGWAGMNIAAEMTVVMACILCVESTGCVWSTGGIRLPDEPKKSIAGQFLFCRQDGIL